MTDPSFPLRWTLLLLWLALVGLWTSSCLNAAEPTEDTLSQIRSRGVLLWGGDGEGGAPFVYPDPEQPSRMIGFEVELATALGAKLGVRAEMVQNMWDGLVPALQRRDFDLIINGLEIIDSRREQVLFSIPYFAYSQQIVVRKEDRDDLQLTDLKGKAVGVLSASAAERVLRDFGAADLRVYPGNVEGFRDLNNRRIDAVVLDLPIAVYYLQKEPQLKRSGQAFAPGYYGIAARLSDTNLIQAVNQAVLDLRQDGTIERIYSRYGVWDQRQAQLDSYQEPTTPAATAPGSTWSNLGKYLPLLLKGAGVTVLISVLSMGLAVALGLILSLARLYGPKPISWLAAIYIEVFRGTPLLIQLYLIYYGLPTIGLRLSAFAAAVIGLGCNYAAYEAENYRAGIQAISRGQFEAAAALGMTRSQTLRWIVLPQALRLILPPVTNDFIALFKDSSLVSVITMVELTKVYGMLATATYDYIGLGLVTAAIYFGMSYPASLLAARLERRLSYDRR
jgi:polar amino acid transport system substrate-binding protein